MVMTDPLSDFLTRIRNACSGGHLAAEAPSSKEKTQIARILMQEGFIESYEVVPARVGENLRVVVRNNHGDKTRLIGLRRVSKPGLRVYAKVEELPKVLGGMGVVIVSTSAGYMTDKEARRRRLGGEVVAFVW